MGTFHVHVYNFQHLFQGKSQTVRVRSYFEDTLLSCKTFIACTAQCSCIMRGKNHNSKET